MHYKNILTLDWETYYDSQYGLKTVPTSLYIKDEKFKIHTCAVKYNDSPAHAYSDMEELQEFFNQIDWTDTALLCHHTQFDGLILAHHFGIVPAFYLDTMSMMRGRHGMSTSTSLNASTAFMGIPTKSDDVEFSKGIRDLSYEDLTRMLEYNINDVEITYQLFNALIHEYPIAELELIDLTIRMFTEPGFLIDVPRAQAEYELEIGNKAKTMLLSGLSKETLGSAAKFGDWLISKGVVPPMKSSLKTGKIGYAFAKTDVAFTSLLEHENEAIRFGVEARLGAKSTSNTSRALRFATEGKLGPLPVYLAYYGAHTGRWSGGNKINLQNLKRGGELRKCLIAPAGFVIGVVDSGQIECRVNGWLSGELSLLKNFKHYDSGDETYDPYRRMASGIYNLPVEEIDKEQRFVGKIAVLGLGFQMGGPKYQTTLVTGAMGMKVDISLTDAYKVVNLYRSENSHIVKMWARCESILEELTKGIPGSYGCISWKHKQIYLPNGMYLEFPHLACTEEDGFTFVTTKGVKKIYGGLLLENIVQALARIIVATQMQEIAKKYKVLTMTHDEVVALIPESEADTGWEFMHKCMTTAPSWCSDLPLSAEGGWDTMYSK